MAFPRPPPNRNRRPDGSRERRAVGTVRGSHIHGSEKLPDSLQPGIGDWRRQEQAAEEDSGRPERETEEKEVTR